MVAAWPPPPRPTRPNLPPNLPTANPNLLQRPNAKASNNVMSNVQNVAKCQVSLSCVRTDSSGRARLHERTAGPSLCMKKNSTAPSL